MRDLKAILKTRLAAMDAVEQKRNGDGADAMDAPGTLQGNRNRAKDDTMEDLDYWPTAQGKRRCVGDLPLDIVRLGQ